MILRPSGSRDNHMTAESGWNEISYAEDMHYGSHLPASTEGSATASEPLG